jgi:hypothetical protein
MRRDASAIDDKHEDANRYCNKQHDDRASWNHNDPYSVRFNIERLNGAWYVTNKTVTIK